MKREKGSGRGPEGVGEISGEKAEMEGEQARYRGNRVEHVHGRTTLGYESARYD